MPFLDTEESDHRRGSESEDKKSLRMLGGKFAPDVSATFHRAFRRQLCRRSSLILESYLRNFRVLAQKIFSGKSSAFSYFCPGLCTSRLSDA